MTEHDQNESVESDYWGFPWDWAFNQPARIAAGKRKMGLNPPRLPDEYWEAVKKATGKDLRPFEHRDAENNHPP